MTLNLAPKSSAKILYMTDRFGVSDGYTRAFNLMLANSGLRRQQIILSNIYTLVNAALVKKGNRKAWGFNPEKKDEIKSAFDQRIHAIKPDVIVCSCPAVLGLLCGWDWNVATLDKCRGGVYDYDGIPVVVTYPITAINTHIDERALQSVDDEDKTHEPYRVRQGQWILNRDWEKIGRIACGRTIKIPDFTHSVVRTLEDALAAKQFLASCVALSTDIETGCYPAQITCIGFCGIQPDGRVHSFVFPFYDPFNESTPGSFWDDEGDHGIAWSIVGDILASPVLKTMQNGFYDCSYFVKYRLDCRNYLLDSMYLWYSLYMELPKTLDFISSILLDNFQYWKDDIKGIENEAVDGRAGMEQYWQYNAKDCYYTLFNTLRLMAVMKNNETFQQNYKDTWMRAMSALSMSMRGIKADKKRLAFHRGNLIVERDLAVARFRTIVDDPEFNIDSPAQKCALLYDVLGARERNDKGRFIDPRKPKSKENTRSSGKTPLKMIRTEHPYFRYIVENLQAAMIPNKQLSDILGNEGPDGKIIGGVKMFTDRFRCAFNPVGTVTTRFSSKSSNFWDGRNVQNINENYRDFLTADEHCILMDVDYSQSDDVFMGYEANDPAKIKVIESGLDGHAVHTELFFNVPYDTVVQGKKDRDPAIMHPTLGVRQISRQIVHGANFQMAALTLYLAWMGREATVAAAKLLGFADADTWTQDRLVNVCAYLMGVYRKRYPRFTKKEYYAEIAHDLRTKGTITNCFGIERRFLGDPGDNGTQREATGYVGQSGTAGNMNRAMYEIDHGYIPPSFRDGVNPMADDRPRMMDWHSHGFMFLLQIHDSFVAQFDTRHPKWKEAAHNLLYVMNRPIIINGHTVRVRTDANFGKRWSKDSMTNWDGRDVHSLDRVAASSLLRGVN